MKMDFLNFVREIYHLKIINGRSILDLTRYNEITMWWTSDVLFYDRLKINNKNYKINDCFRQISYEGFFISFYKIFGIYLELIYDVLMLIIIKSILKLNKSSINLKTEKKPCKKIMFISQDGMWGSKSKTDLFFKPIIDGLKKEKIECIGIYPIDLYPYRGIKVLIDKLKHADFRQVPLNIFLDKNAWKEQRKAQIFYKNNWKLIKKDENFEKKVSSHEDSVKNTIILELSLYFNILYPHLIKYIIIARKLLKKEMPDLLILINESFWWERSLLIAAKLENIPTMAIQHGEIFFPDKRHFYKKDEVGVDGEFNPSSCQIPDKTLVYGEYYRKMLIDYGSYPTSSVITTGTHKFDGLINFIDFKNNNDSQLRKKLNIPNESKVILWTTQCHGMPNSENIDNLTCILNAIDQFQDCILVIKQHPSEPKKYTRLIKKFIKKFNAKVILTPQNIDTISLILLSDVLITKNSTTAIEAKILGKQVIILNLSDEADIVNYVKEGIAIGVYNSDNMVYAISESLNIDNFCDYKRNDFYKKYLNGMQGNASEKIIQEIKKSLSDI